MKLDEARIQHHLTNYLLKRGHVIVLPNIDYSWMRWECDLISITLANYFHEYEIKISHTDFKKDFKKPKHLSLRRRGVNSNRIPNYFTYVAPISAIPLCIPVYAGLIEIAECDRYGQDFELIVIKKPKLIHQAKQTDQSKISMLKTLMYKYWGVTGALDNLKTQVERLKNDSI